MSAEPPLPAASSLELTQAHVLPTYARFPLCLERGQGARVWDEDGREYLDFGGGIAVCSLGHAHPAVTAAVTAQAAKLVHTSNLYYTRPQAELAAAINSFMPAPGRVFFCNSGAEANEGLIKASRRYGQEQQRYQILTCTGSFHGRTMAGISATGQDKVKVGFTPLVPGFKHVPFGDLEAMAAAVDEATVAILVEPIQGEGGIHLPPANYLQGLRKLCDEHGLLLFFDEVQCGLGRTGDLCAWESLTGKEVIPDGVSWAKGIANGYPLGAFWLRESTASGELAELLGPGSHGTTYGGNPVCCAAGLAVLQILRTAGFLEEVRHRGASLQRKLTALASPLVTEVRGLGLMLGIELHPAASFPGQSGTPAVQCTRQALAAGLLIIPAGERVVRLLPPLNVTPEEIERACDLLGRVLQQGVLTASF